MAFRFPLEVLLRVRQTQERKQELRLQEANLRVAMLLRQIEEVHSGMENLEVRRRPQLESGMSAAELQFDVLCRSVLIERQQVLEKQLLDAESLRQSCTQDFRQARRQREVIDTLRLHQLHYYRQQEARQDQRRLDDLFLLRRAYLLRAKRSRTDC
jgi:flagellar export protein FliJ